MGQRMNKSNRQTVEISSHASKIHIKGAVPNDNLGVWVGRSAKQDLCKGSVSRLVG